MSKLGINVNIIHQKFINGKKLNNYSWLECNITINNNYLSNYYHLIFSMLYLIYTYQ